MKILILFLLIHFSLCQFYQWKTVNYDNIEIPANNPIAVQGFQYQTESTEIQWRLTSFDIFDCYLVNNTNFSLLKLGKPFMYQWGMLNTSNCQGDFVNPTIIQSGLQIVAAHNYPFSIRVSFTLTQNVYVDLWALWIPLIVILAIILTDIQIDVNNQVIAPKQYINTFIDTTTLVLNSQISCTFPCNVYLLGISEYQNLTQNLNFTFLQSYIQVNQTSLFSNNYDDFAKNTTLVIYNPQIFNINTTFTIVMLTPNIGSSIAVAIVSAVSLGLLAIFSFGICLGAWFSHAKAIDFKI